jgi:hypothetical protein
VRSVASAATCLIALALVAPASAADRVLPSALDGSLDQSVTYDYNNDAKGPVLFFRQQVTWTLEGGRRPVRLPRRGATTAKLRIAVHIVSNGGGVFADQRGDVPYTCSADRRYPTAAKLRAVATERGWRLTLHPLGGLEPGPPVCTDATAGASFGWPTGGDWFVQRMASSMRLRSPLPRATPFKLGGGPASHDCSDDPRIPLRCTETLGWSGKLELRRR